MTFWPRMVIWSFPMEDMEAENDDVHNRNLLLQRFIFMFQPFVLGGCNASCHKMIRNASKSTCNPPRGGMKCLLPTMSLAASGAKNPASMRWEEPL